MTNMAHAYQAPGGEWPRRLYCMRPPCDTKMFERLVCCWTLPHKRKPGHATCPPHDKSIIADRLCSYVQHLYLVVWDRSEQVTPYILDACAAFGRLKKPHIVILDGKYQMGWRTLKDSVCRDGSASPVTPSDLLVTCGMRASVHW